jgi:hypothetical protein
VARRAVPNPDGGRGVLESFDMGLTLYNLVEDVGETTNVADAHPDVVEKLLGYIEAAREDLGDPLTNRQGKNLRPAGRLPDGASPLPDGVPVPAPRGRGAAGAVPTAPAAD